MKSKTVTDDIKNRNIINGSSLGTYNTSRIRSTSKKSSIRPCTTSSLGITNVKYKKSALTDNDVNIDNVITKDKNWNKGAKSVNEIVDSVRNIILTV